MNKEIEKELEKAGGPMSYLLNTLTEAQQEAMKQCIQFERHQEREQIYKQGREDGYQEAVEDLHSATEVFEKCCKDKKLIDKCPNCQMLDNIKFQLI